MIFKIKRLAPALAGISLLIAFTAAASSDAQSSPSYPSPKRKGEIHRSIKELQNQVTELERKMQSGVVVVCNCVWDAIPIVVQNGDEALPDEPISLPPFKVKGYGYNSILAKWDAIDTCWKIREYWWGYEEAEPPPKASDDDSNSDGSDDTDLERKLAEKEELIEDQESKGMACHYIRDWQH